MSDASESPDAADAGSAGARFRAALDFLAAGDFGEARARFGDLLANDDPNDPEYACGFYASGWWINREDRRTSLKEGRGLADWLMRQWDDFQNIAEEREFTGCLSFRATMRAVLGEAAENYRTAFQQEGASAVDGELLKTLAVCLIRLEDYANAADILLYARRKGRSDAVLFFLLGESLCSQAGPLSEDEDTPREARVKGVSFYRDACLVNATEIDPGLMASQPAVGIFGTLYQEFEHDLERTREWFPARLHAVCFHYEGLRRLSPAEIQHLQSESARLSRDLNQVVERYKERVRATLAFFYLCLMHHHRFHAHDRESARAYEDRLKADVPQMYVVYKEATQGKL